MSPLQRCQLFSSSHQRAVTIIYKYLNLYVCALHMLCSYIDSASKPQRNMGCSKNYFNLSNQNVVIYLNRNKSGLMLLFSSLELNVASLVRNAIKQCLKGLFKISWGMFLPLLSQGIFYALPSFPLHSPQVCSLPPLPTLPNKLDNLGSFISIKQKTSSLQFISISFCRQHRPLIHSKPTT